MYIANIDSAMRLKSGISSTHVGACAQDGARYIKTVESGRDGHGNFRRVL